MLYLIQVIGYSALMCLIYVLLLRNRPMHAFNRVYLLAAAVLPAIIPFMKFPEVVGEQIRTATSMNVRLPEVVIGGVQPSVSYDVFVMAYFCVSMVLLGAFMYKLMSLKQVIAKSVQIKENGYTLLLNSGYGPGSWFTYIFLPGSEQNTTIIEHEAAHIRLHHTRDIIFLNVLQLFLWPNLLLIWIKKELVQVHEFQADEATGADKDAYSELLVSSAFDRCTLPMSHSFMIHPIKRRLMMLRKKGGASKYIIGALSGLVTAVMLVGVVGVQSCKAKKWDVKETGATRTVEDIMKSGGKMPQFNGDMTAFMIENLQYPEEAEAKKIEGKVFVEFTVNEVGDIVNAHVKESPDKSLSVEAMRVVNKMPRWIPGEDKGEKVSVQFTLPISFRLS